MNEVSLFFSLINDFLPFLIMGWAITMALGVVLYIAKSGIALIDAIETSKKSYEDEMRAYDGSEVKPLSLPETGIALDDLLADDGEIPDKYLGGKQ
jgi:hypothetical protein